MLIIVIGFISTPTKKDSIAKEQSDGHESTNVEVNEELVNFNDPAMPIKSDDFSSEEPEVVVEEQEIAPEEIAVMPEGEAYSIDTYDESLGDIQIGPELTNAKPIEEPNIAGTKASVVDSNNHLILLIGHAGVLSVYNKNSKDFYQIDNPVSLASLSDDGKYVVYSLDGLLGSDLNVYNIEKQEMVGIEQLDDRFISDLKIKNGIITFIHGSEDQTDYMLESVTHYDERDDKTSQELIGLKLKNVGPKLFSDEKYVYFLDQNDSVIRSIHPGLHEREVASYIASEPTHFVVVDGKNPFYVDGDTLKDSSNKEITKEGSISKLMTHNNKVYYTNGSGLYLVEGDKSSVFDKRGARASFSDNDLVIQDILHEAFIIEPPFTSE